MSEVVSTAIQKTNLDATSEKKRVAMQRKCACGQHTVAGGECESCRKKRLQLQRWPQNKAESALLSELPPPSGSAATVLRQPRLGPDFSQVQLRTRQPIIQQQPQGEGTFAPEPGQPAAAAASTTIEAEPTPEPPAPTEPTTETAASDATAVSGLLVEDEATDLGEGQFRKSEFLAELRTAVCAAADAELAAAGRDTEGCPYLDYWFDFYGQRDAAHGERALRRYAPEAANATSARDYIPIVAERVRQGVARWARTGEINGLPEGVPTIVPGEPAAESNTTVQAKARDGGTRPDNDPAAIRDALGYGRSLDSGVRSRMESAFGTSFSHVRLHNDSHAAQLSSDQNARAFTIGEHVAFGAGEYQPGTLLGDALIAHELAHVVQQSGTVGSVANMAVGDAGYTALERDADSSAAEAIAALWGGTKGVWTDIAQNALPSVRSGLRLSRCRNDQQQQPQQQQPAPQATISSETVATSPGRRTRRDIGVGEEVNLTHSAGSVTWTTTAGTLSATTGATVRLTAPDTAQTVTVTAGGATKAFTVIAPNGVHRDRFPGSGIRHTHNKPDSGIQTQSFILPDTVNFYNTSYREVDVGAVTSGTYSCHSGTSHDPHPATIPVADTVTAGKGTGPNGRDSAYSGHCGGSPPFTPGSLSFAMPYEYKVGSGSFHRFTTVRQVHVLHADRSRLTTDKAGAHGETTVAAATSTF